MSQKDSLSLTAAILININIMIGIGIFINTVELAKRAGMLACLSYVLVGILMFPLMRSIAQLLAIHPAGGFYIYGNQEITPFAGFISTWAYFMGKLASATLMIHSAVLLLQMLFPALQAVNTFVIDGSIIGTFIILNMQHIRTGALIQRCFFGFKMIPIITVCIIGLLYFNMHHLGAVHLTAAGITGTVPLVLYAVTGFEAACSISSKIKDARINAPRVIFISYALVILIETLYQFFFYGAVGSQLIELFDFRGAFPALFTFVSNAIVQSLAIAAVHIGIACSALGGAYSILFSNSWNLYTLAQHKHVIAWEYFIKLNKNHMPWLCVLAEGIICLLYLAVTHAQQAPLQQMSGLGSLVAYFMSVIALIRAKQSRIDVTVGWWVPLFGLCSCIILAIPTVTGLIRNGFITAGSFVLLLLIGSSMFWYVKSQSTHFKSNQGE